MNETTTMPVAPGGCGNDHATYYTVADVAKRYNVSAKVIYSAINAGVLHAFRAGGWRITEEALQSFEQNGGFTMRRSDATTTGRPKTRSRTTRSRTSMGRRPVITKITL